MKSHILIAHEIKASEMNKKDFMDQPIYSKHLMTVISHDCDETVMLMEVLVLHICAHDGCLK